MMNIASHRVRSLSTTSPPEGASDKVRFAIHVKA